jgi:hypothetical protein
LFEAAGAKALTNRPSYLQRQAMQFQFLLSGPHGDIELSPEDLAQPFLISPQEQHPFLKLADYFGALQEFILLEEGSLLCAALQKQGLPADINTDDITEVIIRSEKHGAYYHIASAEIVGPGVKSKFAVTTAVSEYAKKSLQAEHEILQKLFQIMPDYLPELFYRETVVQRTDVGAAEFIMVLGEWLEGYHEWHVSHDPETEKQKIELWDYAQGLRFLSDVESYEMLRQVASILTYYYDQSSFCQIYPWHHGAGDFVVKSEAGVISVKLITARQYEPLVYFEGEEEADRLVAAIHFLLNMSLRIRLDRFGGVGEPAWLKEFAVQAAVDGFFAGLHASAAANRLMVGPAADFLEIMQSFDPQEIFDMYGSLLQIYADEDEDDFRLIQDKLTGHAAQLHDALQRFSLGKL